MTLEKQDNIFAIMSQSGKAVNIVFKEVVQENTTFTIGLTSLDKIMSGEWKSVNLSKIIFDKED